MPCLALPIPPLKLELDELHWLEYRYGMDMEKIHILQQEGGLARLHDGKLGVPITLQYRGQVPSKTRRECNEWLHQHFVEFNQTLTSAGIDLPPVSSAAVSGSAQTLNTVVALDQLEALDTMMIGTNHRLDILVPQRAIL